MPKINWLRLAASGISFVASVIALIKEIPVVWWALSIVATILLASGLRMHFAIRREWIKLRWESLTDSFSNESVLNPEVCFHFEIHNGSDVPLTARSATGRLSFEGQRFFYGVELDNPLTVQPHSDGQLNVVQRLTDREAAFLRKFKSEHSQERGYSFNASRLRCIVSAKRLMALFANQVDVGLPDPGFRNR